MANLNELKSNFIEKIDDLFGFNIQNKTDGISYDFGQYRLNKLYKPLVKYFIDQFMESLGDYSDQDTKKVIGLFTDFFSLYYNNGDFGYFKNKFSSYEYRIPYSGKDTEFRWATKDCYYVKTSDVVNNMNINIGGLLENKEVQIKMYKKTEPIETDTGDIKYNFDIRIDDIYDEDENIIGYNLYFINTDETKTAASSPIFQNKISEILNEKGIDYKNSNPLLKKSVEDFMKKWGRDYFIHKRLKDFLTEELEWYFFQMLKNDIQSKAGIFDIQNKIEEIKAKYSDDPDVVEFKIGQLMKESNPEFKGNVYQEAYLWIKNYINIIADLEEFKAKLWNKKRKIVEQNYCISLGKIKERESLNPRREEMLKYIFNNEKQIQEWKDLGMSDNPKIDDDYLVVDTKNFVGEERKNLINLINEDRLIGKLYNSDNYQALLNIEQDNTHKIDCIYIDPPYNTGQGDFTYKDGFSSSSWATMMTERLNQSKMLLGDDGIILISIDENEYYELKILCDNVFGSSNYIENFIWRKNATKNLSRTTSTNHEYILCYAKNRTNIESLQLFRKKKEGLDDVKKILTEAQNNNDTVKSAQERLRNFYKEHPELKGISMYNNVEYSQELGCLRAYTLDNISAPKATGKAATYEILHPKTGKPCKIPSRGRGFTKSSMDELIKKNLIEFYDDENHVPRIKRYLDTVETDVIKSVIDDNTDGKKEVARLFSECPFSNPKPTTLIKYYLQIIKKNGTVLDFFAGSGTTGHALFDLNKQDGGHRKLIEVELGKYFNDVTLVRTKKVQYSQNRKDGKAVDNDGTLGAIEYTKLNQYEDWFNDGGYLDKIEGDISELSNKTIDSANDIKEILYPLNELKDKIYHLDDELDN